MGNNNAITIQYSKILSIHNGYSKIVQSFERGGGQNLKIDDVILGGGLGMNIVDDGGGRGLIMAEK